LLNPKLLLMRKTPYYLTIKAFFCFVFIFSLQPCFAQFISIPTKISTPVGKITVNQQIHVPNAYGQGYNFTPKKHLFTVVLLNDSTIEVNGRIKAKEGAHELKCKINSIKTTILPSETKKILVDEVDGPTLVGTPMDSCWAFLVGTGRIRSYSVNVEADNLVIAYIQKGGEAPIVPLTKENLEPMVSDNEKALKLVQKGRLLKALKVYNQVWSVEE